MADLVSGKYSQVEPSQGPVFGLAGSVAQANVPAKTNAQYLGWSGVTDNASVLATNTITLVPVPVDLGVTYSVVHAYIGATAATVTHNYAAVYSGTSNAALAVLLGQSVDATSTPPTVSQVATFTLGSPVTATASNAPNGYWYVGLQVTGTTPFSVGAVPVAQAIVSKINAAVTTAAPSSFVLSVAATTGTAPSTAGTVTTTATAAPILTLR